MNRMLFVCVAVAVFGWGCATTSFQGEVALCIDNEKVGRNCASLAIDVNEEGQTLLCGDSWLFGGALTTANTCFTFNENDTEVDVIPPSEDSIEP